MKQIVMTDEKKAYVEEKDTWRANCMLILACADMMETATTSLESGLKKMGLPHNLNVRKYVDVINENAKAFVRMFDNKADEAEAARFGEVCDKIHELVMNKSLSYVRKERKIEERYAKNREKAAARR